MLIVAASLNEVFGTLHRLLLIDTLLCNSDMDADIAVDEIVRRLCPAGEVVRQRIPRRIADGPGA